MRVVCVYDNRSKPNVFIQNIIGDKKFGDVILKRKSIREKFYEFMDKMDFIGERLEINLDTDADRLLLRLRSLDPDTHVIHIFSYTAVYEEKRAKILIEKSPYIHENYVWTDHGTPLVFMMDNLVDYCGFTEKYLKELHLKACYDNNDYRFKSFQTEAYCDLSDHGNFIKYISGGFDTSFFNSVSGDEFVVKKSSKDKRKMKAEYEYWHLLPDYMKPWFVMPYNYQESGDYASYEMERYHVTDLAIRWVHGAVSGEEFEHLLKKIFYFLSVREKKEVSSEEYSQLEKALFVEKVRSRLAQLKGYSEYEAFEHFLSNGCRYSSLEEIVKAYMELYDQVGGKLKPGCISVIGHGDLCFSNMLYHKDSDMLKLIDPKGAVLKEEMWTNPYYDIAKLSHSICGKYDFFNNGLHQIVLDQSMKFHVTVEFDNRVFKQMFRKQVEEAGFSYTAVRLYECSLFLSMLPLHMDNPQKVFGFILNAVDMIEEVKECLKE